MNLGNWDEELSLKSRIMVAGGGGGTIYASTESYWVGGNGGGLTGEKSSLNYDYGEENSTFTLSLPGTQSGGFKLGKGQDASNKTLVANGGAEGNGGGGGGYYGGYTCEKIGVNSNCGGGGGSGYISPLFYNSTMKTGVHLGSGMAKFTLMTTNPFISKQFWTFHIYKFYLLTQLISAI